MVVTGSDIRRASVPLLILPPSIVLLLDPKGRHQNIQQRISKADKSLLVSLQNSGIFLVCKSMQRFDKTCLQFTKRY